MPTLHNQVLNTVHRAETVNDQVEAALEQLLTDPSLQDPDDQRRSSAVRYALLETMKCIVGNVPQGGDRREALTMFRSIRRLCNDAIASGGGF